MNSVDKEIIEDLNEKGNVLEKDGRYEDALVAFDECITGIAKGKNCAETDYKLRFLRHRRSKSIFFKSDAALRSRLAIPKASLSRECNCR